MVAHHLSLWALLVAQALAWAPTDDFIHYTTVDAPQGDVRQVAPGDARSSCLADPRCIGYNSVGPMRSTETFIFTPSLAWMAEARDCVSGEGVNGLLRSRAKGKQTKERDESNRLIAEGSDAGLHAIDPSAVAQTTAGDGYRSARARFSGCAQLCLFGGALNAFRPFQRVSALSRHLLSPYLRQSSVAVSVARVRVTRVVE